MSHAIGPALIPPLPGLEKEEPEQSYEDDIPKDDRGTASQEEAQSPERPLRDVERE